jgi:hypothetical protein
MRWKCIERNALLVPGELTTRASETTIQEH